MNERSVHSFTWSIWNVNTKAILIWFHWVFDFDFKISISISLIIFCFLYRAHWQERPHMKTNKVLVSLTKNISTVENNVYDWICSQKYAEYVNCRVFRSNANNQINKLKLEKCTTTKGLTSIFLSTARSVPFKGYKLFCKAIISIYSIYATNQSKSLCSELLII